MVGGLYLKEPPIRHRVSSIHREVEEGVLKLVGVGKRRPESDATGAAKAQLAAQLAGEDGKWPERVYR